MKWWPSDHLNPLDVWLPAVRQVLQSEKRPQKFLSVFAPVNARYLLFICSQLQPTPTALTKLAAIPVS